MQVTERMQALGDHAKSSRQPPLKERKSAKADASAAKQDVIDETILENGAAHDSAVAMLVDEVTPQIVVPESGDGAESSSDEVAHCAVAAPHAGNSGTSQKDDETSAAKRAIIHEWENWSALNSDELGDPNVAEYFFRHLETKKACLLDFISDDKQKTVFGLLLRNA